MLLRFFCLCCCLYLLHLFVLHSGCFTPCDNFWFLVAFLLVFMLLSGYFSFCVCVLVALCCVLIALILVFVLHSCCSAPCVNVAFWFLPVLRSCCFLYALLLMFVLRSHCFASSARITCWLLWCLNSCNFMSLCFLC